jgi:hypothetical protein
MASVTMELRGAEQAVAKLARTIDVAYAQARWFVRWGTQMMYDNSRTFLQLTDHSAHDLRRLGYPYARRFGPGTLHPDFWVHAQSGRLASGLEMRIRETVYNITGTVRNTVYYDVFVQRGAYKMRPRPYMHQVRLEMEPTVHDMVNTLRQAIVVTLRGP